MDRLDRLIVFDIVGPMAHFRKYYTNSSSLSYAFPPRTVIIGMIAGILGYPRDSYYERFSSRRCHVGISIVTPVRSIYKTVNYLSVKSRNDVNGINGHTQVPLEILLPEDLSANNLCYRIYFWHSEDEIMDELERRLNEKRFVYPLYMGLTEFIAYVSKVFTLNGSDMEIRCSDNYTDIVTVCNLDTIEEGGLSFKTDGSPMQYIKEIAPLGFSEGRQSVVPAYFVYEKNQRHLKVRLRGPYLTVNLGGVTENITFMEAE
ncbi:CRISPR-associated protein Cas5h [Caldanaerobius fijiensis DSM 17918]|uniref:CRISPR-associated protein Cas5h n=1 Tax=Caldanaerobius fijiensis DSM 17918 TaxID=1121256 RepID=A0A1M5B898_9THEO|nr:type I-B CRISPR-associated protein Cas5b [Caldanaerobius fijiensis]SHF38753.1 CRISPR-associated protein Cas5h [Caldanaerobius fijiensis DSM 17918]